MYCATFVWLQWILQTWNDHGDLWIQGTVESEFYICLLPLIEPSCYPVLEVKILQFFLVLGDIGIFVLLCSENLCAEWKNVLLNFLWLFYRHRVVVALNILKPFICRKRKRKTEVCFPWSANNKRKWTIAVSANVPIYADTHRWIEPVTN